MVFIREYEATTFEPILQNDGCEHVVNQDLEIKSIKYAIQYISTNKFILIHLKKKCSPKLKNELTLNITAPFYGTPASHSRNLAN